MHRELLIGRDIRCYLIVVLAWFLGYYGFSLLWFGVVFVCLVLDRFRRAQYASVHEMIASNQQQQRRRQLIGAEEEEGSHAPAWVNFPDFERVDFLNKVLQRFWPFMTDYLKRTVFVDMVERIVKTSHPMLGDFRFVHLDLGDIAPQIGGVRAYTNGLKSNQVKIDMQLLYSGDAIVKFQVKKLTAGIKSIQLNGDTRIILDPLVKEMPFAANLVFFFLRSPHVSFDLTDFGNVMDIPGLKDLLMAVVNDLIKNMTVAPNRQVIPLIPNSLTTKLFNCDPKGAVHIRIVSGRDLMMADFGVFSKGKSDPYVNVYVAGSRVMRTSVKSNATHPNWNETTELIIDENFTNTMFFEVRDEDPGEDDHIGNFEVQIKEIMQEGYIDRWFALSNATSGEILVQLTWLEAINSPTLAAAILEPKLEHDVFSAAILTVFVQSVKCLPKIRRRYAGYSDPNPYCIIQVENEQRKTQMLLDTTDPEFNHTEQFLIKHPDLNLLTVKIEDQKVGEHIGMIRYPLKDIFNAPDMKISKEFQITQACNSDNPSIQLTFSMKLLLPRGTPQTITSMEKITQSNTKAKWFGQRVSQGFLRSRPNVNVFNGEAKYITLSVGYHKDFQTLRIHIVSASNLSSDKPLSTFVRIHLSPDAKEHARTGVVKNCSNPSYDAIVDWPMALEKAKAQTLKVCVRKSGGSILEREHKVGWVDIDMAKLLIDKIYFQTYRLHEEGRKDDYTAAQLEEIA